MRIWRTSFLCLLVAGTCWSSHSREARLDLLVPDELAKCMDQARSENKEIRIISGGNPFYLRGDFDADDRADYVTMVISGELESSPCHECKGVLFCFGSGATDVLGAKVGPLPVGVDSEYFLGSHWEVSSTTEPYVEPLGADGEVVVMSWEDAWGILYLQSGRYKWKFERSMPDWGDNREPETGEPD